MKRFFFLGVLLFLTAIHPAKASLEYNARLSAAYQHILRLDFETGQAILEVEKAENPSNRLVFLYESYIDFLRAFISEEPAQFTRFKKNFHDRYEAIEEAGKDSPWCLFALAELKLQEAFLKIKFREFISAAFGVRSAYKLLEKNGKLWPAFMLNGKAMGLVHAAVGSVPPEYRWLTELAGMKGTIKQGLDELRGTQESATGLYAPYAEEILFFISTLQCSLGFAPAELNATAVRVKPFTEVSPLLCYSYINLCIRAGASSLALDQVRTEWPGRYPFHFLNYKKGMLLLYTLDLRSEDYFKRYLDLYKGMNFIKAAYQKLAWISLLRQDTALYRARMNAASVSGTTFIDDDKQTDAEAHSGELPSLLLLRARLLFDGGYYDKALAEFRHTTLVDFPRYRDQLELTYRLGRIYKAQALEDKAIPLFRQTLRNGENTTWHFAANSALQLGTIYEEQGRIDSAAYYYNRCLDLRHHEYQNSIDQKAQAGLERVKENKRIK